MKLVLISDCGLFSIEFFERELRFGWWPPGQKQTYGTGGRRGDNGPIREPPTDCSFSDESALTRIVGIGNHVDAAGFTFR